MMLIGTPASLDKVRSARAATERHIVELEASRRAALLGNGDVAAIDKIDVDIQAERRRIVILDQKLEALQADQRRQEREKREAVRIDAIKKIAAHLRTRQAVAVEFEAELKRLAQRYEKLSDTAEIRAAWPYPMELPGYFSWQCGALPWETARALGRQCRAMLPGPVLDAIASSYAGDGIARAAAPSKVTGIADTFEAHARHLLDTLAKVRINSDEDDASEEAAA
jgi:hypothetical protein